jgi:hypothetical protein
MAMTNLLNVWRASFVRALCSILQNVGAVTGMSFVACHALSNALPPDSILEHDGHALPRSTIPHPCAGCRE